MSFSASRRTRLGAYGATRAPYGSFAGRDVAPPVLDVPASPLGLSPWTEIHTESAEERKERIQKMREAMGIVEVVKQIDEIEAKEAAEANAEQQGKIARLRLKREQEAAQRRAEDRRVLMVLEAMERRRKLEIKRRMALLMLAAEA